MSLQIGQREVRTDPGRKRHHNEDSYVFQPPLFAIADGMGGARRARWPQRSPPTRSTRRSAETVASGSWWG